jgi:phage terminase small subunit
MEGTVSHLAVPFVVPVRDHSCLLTGFSVYKERWCCRMAELTAKQKRFCDEYLIDLNATQAAIRAGYSEKTAMEQGYQLLQKTSVAEYIAERKADRIERTEITQDMVLKELANIAFSNAADFAKVIEKQAMVDVEGKMIPMYDADGKPVLYRTVEPVLTEELTEEQKRALSVIKKGRDGFEVKPYDKVKALELLGKHLGMWTDKVEVEAIVPIFGGEDALEE